MRIDIKNQNLFKKCLNNILSDSIDLEIKGISIDSRKIKKDDIFIALQGDKNHGNDFIDSHLLNKASFIVSDKKIINDKVFIVNNSRDFLKNLAIEFRSSLKAKFIGITGTNGKTSTKELLVKFLKTKYNVSYSKGNYNSTISLPLSLLECDEKSEYCILEMGASRYGEISDLCEIAKPDLGLITNISEAHLEGFDTFEDLIKTKLSLYKFLKNNCGTYFFNKDDSNIKIGQERYPEIVSFSFNDANSDYYGDISEINKGNIYINNILFKAPYQTEIFASNFLASYSIASSIGVESEKIKKALNDFSLPRGRGNTLEFNNVKVIDDTYNANFESMKKGISQLKVFNRGKNVLILGDMLELSTQAVAIHKRLGRYIDSLDFIDSVYGIGKLIKHSIDAIKKDSINKAHFSDKKTFIEYFSNHKKKYNVIYIKGSRSMKLENIIGSLFEVKC